MPKDATDQLRKIHGISITIKSRDIVNGAFCVVASATDKTGRTDEAIGVVYIGKPERRRIGQRYDEGRNQSKGELPCR